MLMYNREPYPNYSALLRRRPQALAIISGSEYYPNIQGQVRFYDTAYGVLVSAEITGLPSGARCQSPIFGFHIHEGRDCRGSYNDPFASTRNHYDPYSCPHPYHAGDLPPLFGAAGNAFSVFLTNRFTLDEIVGKTVVIHSAPDDFTSQPSGNAGDKIACGVIQA